MKRVLIVDDHTENLYLLEVLLGGNGFETVSASNGAEALELACSRPPDLIISDILMPVMDGYTLCRTLKADLQMRNIPFIFYTATFTTARDEALALSLGADRFVIKPMEPESLMQTIQEVLAMPRPVGNEPDACPGELLKEYGEAMFRKLEKKLADLEQANQELKRREKELVIAREAAECADRAKMRFLAIMSHELRTPLHTILGTLQLLELEKSYNPSMTDAAKSALFSMVAMIDNILEMSRLESAQVNFASVPVDLHDLADAVLQLFSYAAKSKGIELRLTIADNLPRQLAMDRVHLQQILVHLMSNAIKFTDRGSVEMRIEKMGGTASERSMLCIEVEDSGIGIDPDMQRLIFEPFTQVDVSNTRQHGGIGLGLALTKRLVELMGGNISVRSKSREGSLFTICLPVSDDSGIGPVWGERAGAVEAV